MTSAGHGSRLGSRSGIPLDNRLGILVGLEEEARLIGRFLPKAAVALSHAHEPGARAGLAALRRSGVEALLSFGCAGGLEPALQPGTVLVAEAVVTKRGRWQPDAALSDQFGAEKARRGSVLHSPIMIASAQEKRRLRAETGCVAVDMESGLVAESGLPFAVLRVVCDDAAQNLPPAAAVGLRDGRVSLPAVLGSLLRQPNQIGALIALGRDASKARSQMRRFLEEIFPVLTPSKT